MFLISGLVLPIRIPYDREMTTNLGYLNRITFGDIDTE